MPSQFVGKNRKQLIGDLIVFQDQTIGNLCFPGTTQETEGYKMNSLKEMASLCKPQRTVWSLAIHLFCFSVVLISRKNTQNQRPLFMWPSQESWRNKDQLKLKAADNIRQIAPLRDGILTLS